MDLEITYQLRRKIDHHNGVEQVQITLANGKSYLLVAVSGCLQVQTDRAAIVEQVSPQIIRVLT